MEPLTILTLLSTLGAGTWSVWQWSEEQKKARQQKRNVMAALYVNSFIFAAEVLQERLYSILTHADLQANRSRAGQGAQSNGSASPLAIEILYELGQFFGWSNYAFRYGPYTSDEPAIRLLFKISGTFAAQDGFAGDAFRFSIPEQMALGWAMVKYTGQNINSYPEYQAITLFEFEDELREAEGKKHSLYRSEAIQNSIHAIDRAEAPDELEGRERLSEIQGLLVDALNHFESREKFCVALGPRQKVMSDVAMTPASPPNPGGAQVVHHIRGRIRLHIPGLARGGTAAQQLRSALTNMGGISSVRLNSVARSLIVSYEPGLSMAEVENGLLAAIARAFAGNGPGKWA